MVRGQGSSPQHMGGSQEGQEAAGHPTAGCGGTQHPTARPRLASLPPLGHVLSWAGLEEGSGEVGAAPGEGREPDTKGGPTSPTPGHGERGHAGTGSRAHSGAHTGVCTGAAGGQASQGGSYNQAGHGKIEFPCRFQTSSLDSSPWQWLSCNGFSRRDGPGTRRADVPPAPQPLCAHWPPAVPRGGKRPHGGQC